jgi:large subunit GTPase 1
MDALKEGEEDVEDLDDTREELEEDLDDLEIDVQSDLSDHEDATEVSEQEADGDDDPRTRILTVHELQSLFLREAPTPKGHDPLHPTKLVVGLVGYPNVGKSSIINSLLGQKRVSVSSTPGKTKHFETIHLPPSDDGALEVILCDCPGLVFPNFASTKAELVCNGILPIDQLREWTGPASLLTRRIRKEVFEQVYSFKVYSKDEMNVTGEELLISFACNHPAPIFFGFGSVINGFSGPGIQKSWTPRKPR